MWHLYKTNWYYTFPVDDGKEDEKEGKSADSTPGSCSVSEKLENIREDKEEQTDVFGDTVESLQRIAPPSGGYIAECSSYSDQMKLIQHF